MKSKNVNNSLVAALAGCLLFPSFIGSTSVIAEEMTPNPVQQAVMPSAKENEKSMNEGRAAKNLIQNPDFQSNIIGTEYQIPQWQMYRNFYPVTAIVFNGGGFIGNATLYGSNKRFSLLLQFQTADIRQQISTYTDNDYELSVDVEIQDQLGKYSILAVDLFTGNNIIEHVSRSSGKQTFRFVAEHSLIGIELGGRNYETSSPLIVIFKNPSLINLTDIAIDSVEALFRNSQRDALADGVGQAQINEVKGRVNALSSRAIKEELTELVARAQDFEYARSNVNTLFKDPGEDSQLADVVDQAIIDEISLSVEELYPGAWKNEQLERIQKAQRLLDKPKDEAEARASVVALFRNDTKDALKAGVGQTEINEAKGKVDALIDGEVKAELTVLVERAQSFEAARSDVDALFTDPGEDSQLAGWVDQSIIDEMRQFMESIYPGAWKNEQWARIQKAQRLLDKSKEAEARTSVAGLFRDPTQDALKNGVGQAQINEAKGKVDALIDGQVKAELTELVDRAQSFEDARSDVDALFKDPGEDSQLAGWVDQSIIDEMKQLMESIYPGAWKNEQWKRVQKAQALWDEK